MSVQQYGAAVVDLAKAGIKKWIKSNIKIIAIIVVVVSSIFLPFFVIIGKAEEEENSASYQGMQSASSTSWEQFLRYVETKEGGTRVNQAGEEDSNGAYYIVEDDYANNPTVGHGLCLYSSGSYLNVEAFSKYGIDTKELVTQYNTAISNGYNSKNPEHYKYFPKVSVQICDAIWEEGVKSRYESIVAQYPDLTTYQHYALTDVKYRRGNTEGFQAEYNSKWSSSDDKYGEEYEEANESFSTDTLFDFFWNGGHSLEGVRIRKQDQWILFKYGYYRPLGECFIGSNSTGYADTSSLNANDYGGTYLSSSNGYTFIQYYQNGSSWSSDTLRGASGTNLGMSGCNVTSNAIVLSALTGDTITPRQVNNNFDFINNSSSAILNTSEFSKYASEIGIGEYVSSSVNTLITYLREGKVVILKFDTDIGYVNGWAASTHFVVCADYKYENGTDYVYIINPARGASKATGWYPTSAINVPGWVFMRSYYRK